jgi:hypothetical protein
MAGEVVTEMVLKEAECIRIPKSLIEIILPIRRLPAELPKLFGNNLGGRLMAPWAALIKMLQHCPLLPLRSNTGNRIIPAVLVASGLLVKDRLVETEEHH